MPVSARIKQLLVAIRELQPLPANVSRILKATDDTNITAGLLSELIGLDQAIAANVLQMSNAVSMGYGPQCSTLSDAVMRLGFKRIRNIVMGIGASGPLSRRLNGYRLGAGQLWSHSVATAMAAQWLSQRTNYPNPDEAYVAGLLHDIGKLLLDQYILIDYQQILYSVQIRKKMLCEAEEELIGINHAKIGSLIADRWNFPKLLSEAIECHHNPSLALEQPQLAAIINLANAFSSKDEAGLMDPFGRVAHPASLRILDITEVKAQRLEEALDRYLKLHPSD